MNMWCHRSTCWKLFLYERAVVLRSIKLKRKVLTKKHKTCEDKSNGKSVSLKKTVSELWSPKSHLIFLHLKLPPSRLRKNEWLIRIRDKMNVYVKLRLCWYTQYVSTEKHKKKNVSFRRKWIQYSNNIKTWCRKYVNLRIQFLLPNKTQVFIRKYIIICLEGMRFRMFLFVTGRCLTFKRLFIF